MSYPLLRRLTAFSSDPSGGNPAGVWIGEDLPEPGEMQRIAAEVGYSETAFVCPVEGERRTVRYFSPEIEVSFCGHATIAAGVLLGEITGEGRYLLDTPVGEVPVVVVRTDEGFEASLTSVDPRYEPAADSLVEEALSALRWQGSELDPSIPPARAYAGAWHLVLAVSSEVTLARLDYDFEGLKKAMAKADLTTLQLVWREEESLFHCRNPFPVGGVVEDPATGAAAAALGGYLREARLLAAPASFIILQGETMGRPSRLRVDVPESGGIVVSGRGVSIDG